jgi:hypothetical protein
MEQCSFKQCLQVLNKYDITIVTNSEVDMTKFNDISQMCGKSFSIELFDKEYFEGIKGYNALCLSKAFYQRFADRYGRICKVPWMGYPKILNTRYMKNAVSLVPLL